MGAVGPMFSRVISLGCDFLARHRRFTLDNRVGSVGLLFHRDELGTQTKAPTMTTPANTTATRKALFGTGPIGEILNRYGFSVAPHRPGASADILFGDLSVFHGSALDCLSWLYSVVAPAQTNLTVNRWTTAVLTDNSVAWSQRNQYSFAATIDGSALLLKPLQILADGADVSSNENWAAYDIIFARVIRREKV